METKKLTVSSSPHLRSSNTVQRAMLLVLAALTPAALFAAYYYGYYVLLLLVLGVSSAVLFEAAILKLRNKPVSRVLDGSAAVTGLLLALSLPAGAPWWIAVLGSMLAIGIGKQLFGGLGHNPFNPALAARAILVVSWPARMTAWVGPGLVSSATPIAQYREGLAIPPMRDLFFGFRPGSLGEMSVFLLLVGGLALIFLEIIDWKIPVSFVGTVALLTWILPREGQSGFFTGDPLFHVLSGSLILGAFFMATDWTTTPITKRGRVIMGIGAGLIVAIIRLYGALPEGVTFAILIMNACTPLIDRFTLGRSFGSVREAA